MLRDARVSCYLFCVVARLQCGAKVRAGIAEVSYLSNDLMHCGDLGVSLYLLGNCLYSLFEEVGGVKSRPRSGCAELLQILRQASKYLGQPKTIGSLPYALFKPASSPPRLMAKAADGRLLLFAMELVLQRFMPLNTEHVGQEFNVT